MPAPTTLSETTGGIKATVQSTEGLPVPGVQIRLKHQDGRIWTTLTDDLGRFQAGGLPPGEYHIESRLAGFRGELGSIQIKAQAWLLGVPRPPVVDRVAGVKVLRFHGSAVYEYAPGLITPQKRPVLEKIPMH